MKKNHHFCNVLICNWLNLMEICRFYNLDIGYSFYKIYLSGSNERMLKTNVNFESV